jgi:hypothetical protein
MRATPETHSRSPCTVEYLCDCCCYYPKNCSISRQHAHKRSRSTLAPSIFFFKKSGDQSVEESTGDRSRLSVPRAWGGGWWLMAGADLFWEKSTAGWLLMAGLFWEKSTAGWWLISQTNRVGDACSVERFVSSTSHAEYGREACQHVRLAVLTSHQWVWLVYSEKKITFCLLPL